ncbi:MAG TPA: isoprenylcysteine carboxylmethyltransferase family protein [Caulobacteraceae bacterium]
MASLTLDFAERGLLIALYLMLFQRLLPSLGREPLNTLLLISESIVVGFVVFRRTTLTVTKNPLDWLMALAGTIPPLFLRPGGHPLAPPLVGALMMTAGVLIHVWAKLALRRSFGMAAANRGVKIEGPYRVVRHPMYVGYAITWAGFVLLNPTWLNAGLCLFAAAMQVMRILAEERLLAADSAYRAYTTRTKFRILPGIF